MGGLRIFKRSNRWLAFWLIAAALAVKALVPPGYMIVPGKTLTVAVCTGMGVAEMTITIPMEPGKGDPAPAGKGQDATCPFAGLTQLALAGADLALLVAAIAFILSLGTAPVVLPRIRRPSHFQPPLRGPPALA